MATAILSWLFLAAQLNDPVSVGLERYLRLDAQTNSEAVMAFWMEKAASQNIRAARWSVDPSEECENFVAHLPATEPHPATPFLMIHDFSMKGVDAVKPAVWKRTDTGWRMETEKLRSDRLTGWVQWEAFRSFKDVARIRDIFFVATCGDNPESPYGIRAFLKYMVRGSEEDAAKLSTLQKIKLSHLHEKFEGQLPKIGFVWNAGIPGLKFGRSQKVATLSNVQKGRWLVDIELFGEDAAANLVRLAHHLLETNKAWQRFLHAPHPEMTAYAKSHRASLSWIEQKIVGLYPRYYFWRKGQMDLLDNQWSIIDLNSTKARLAYSFTGELTENELKKRVSSKSAEIFSSDLPLRLSTVRYDPFRRSLLTETFDFAFDHLFSQSKDFSWSPFIQSDLTLSRFFRNIDIFAVDWSPVFFDKGSQQPRLSPADLKQSIELSKQLFLQRGMLQ